MQLSQRIKSAIKSFRGIPLDNPAIPLSGRGIWTWMDNDVPTVSGERINPFTAMQLVTVYSCVRVIAESVASLPLQVWRRDGMVKTIAADNPLYTLLTSTPNAEMTSFSFWESFAGSLALTGNAYAQIQRNDAGFPVGLWPLNPIKTSPVRLPDGSLGYKTSDGEQNGQERKIASADMLHCPLFAFDGVKGLSPVEQARQTLGLARAAEKFGAKFFGNGSRPGGVLSGPSDLAPEQMSQSKEAWEAANGGSNQGRTAVMPGNWTYTQIGLSPEEGQFLETQQFTREQIASLFRVPAQMLGDTSKISHSTAQQQNLTFVTDCLRSYLSRIEAEIGRKLLNETGKPGEFFAAFDVTERLRGDFQTTMTGLALARQWGFASINDCRSELGQNPIGPEGDVYLFPLNMGNAADLVKGSDTLEDVPNLGVMRSAFARLFRDAVGKTCKRDKRDAATLTTIFEPLLASISDSIAESAKQRTGDVDFTFDASKSIRNAIEKLTTRSAKWSSDEADQIARDEFSRIFKSIAFDISRASATHTALKELSA